ncbi:MAG: DUF1493 family protein [Sneathiellales bacterium]|nr:DUF1493 family protein [Sneathiellales bacterium]
MSDIHKLFDFISRETGIDAKILNLDSDISMEFGVYGDDLLELIDRYSIEFEVNIESFLWYFHSPEEATNPFRLIFPPPDRRVERIPITPRMLFTFMETGNWDLEYPRHRLPARRWDIISLKIFLLTVGLSGLIIAVLS